MRTGLKLYNWVAQTMQSIIRCTAAYRTYPTEQTPYQMDRMIPTLSVLFRLSARKGDSWRKKSLSHTTSGTFEMSIQHGHCGTDHPGQHQLHRQSP